jgi:hypothetical protein
VAIWICGDGARSGVQCCRFGFPAPPGWYSDPMTIGNDSPLRKIPSVLGRHQILFFEGMRFTIEMAEVAYQRLQHTLPLLADHQHLNRDPPPTVSAMLDAWSIVDSLHRLRDLIQAAPGLSGKKKSPKIRLFMDATDNVTALRNTVQHLNSEIHKILDDRNWTVFGTLSWGVVDPDKNQITACTFLPGAPQQGSSHPIINPLNRRVWHLRVDSITLERSGVSVCISDAMRRLEALTISMEENLARAYAEQIPLEHQGKTHGADVVICMKIGVQPEQIVPENMPDPEPDLPPSDGPDDGDVDNDDSLLAPNL